LLQGQEKQNIVDNPVMEFVKSDITITLIARKDKIQSGEELEIRAEAKRRDCTAVPNVKVWFATSNSNSADFTDNKDKMTDDEGFAFNN
jgi:hypothetical protein